MKLLAKYLIATSLALFLVGLLAAFGNRQLSLSPSSAPNFSAYPLPGTPTPRGSGPIASPTRLAAYPLPGASPATPRAGAPGAPLSFTPVATSYLPLVEMHHCVEARGTAGTMTSMDNVGFTSTLTMQNCWGYEWNQVYSPNDPAYTMPWEVINDVRSKPSGVWDVSFENNGCPLPAGDHFSPTVQAALQTCVGNIAAARPGMYWMIWNEPDVANQDNIAPSLAMSYFVVISNTILGNDPTARLIVGNVGSYYAPGNNACCGVYWLSHFITEGHNLGITVTDFISGYGFHAYPQLIETGIGGSESCGQNTAELFSTTADSCLLSNFTLTVKTTRDWLAVNDPGKQLWLTEFNWWPDPDPNETYDTQVRRMGQMCAQLKTNWPVDRYSWFYAAHEATYRRYALDLFQEIYTGTLSPSGVTYPITC